MLPRRIRALALLAILPLAFSQQGCQPKANEVAMKVGAPTQSAVSVRSLQTRRFDTLDEAALLSASIETLQDLGFTITEASNLVGVVVASKQRDAEESGQVAGAIMLAILFGANAAVWDKEQTIQVTLTATPIQNSKQIEIRVSFDRNLVNNKGQLWRAELLLEPKLYQEFFNKLSQAAFLEAHTI